MILTFNGTSKQDKYRGVDPLAILDDLARSVQI